MATRAELVQQLRDSGYTGPVSYTKTRLEELLAERSASAPDSPETEAPTAPESTPEQPAPKQQKRAAKPVKRIGDRNPELDAKKEKGYGFYCAMSLHSPALCEREMKEGRQDGCTCPCHEERDFTLTTEEITDAEEATSDAEG